MSSDTAAGRTVTNEQVIAKWLEIAPGIQKMMERIADPQDFALSPRSGLAGDDKISAPYQVSHAVRSCLVSGVDHLHAAKSLVLDLNVLHASAVFSLVRGALENLSAAFWILHPPEQDDRIEHVLRWQAQNFKDQKTALEPRGLADDSSYQGRLAKLYAIATPRGISTAAVKSGFQSTVAVTYAEKHAPNAASLLFLWRMCSGFAHGRPWAVFGVLQQDRHESADPDVVNMKLTSDLGRVLLPTLAAFRLMVAVVELLHERSQASG